MTRRNFLKHSLGAGAVLPLATPAVAQAKTALRLVTTDVTAAETLAAYVGDATDGALSIDVTDVGTDRAAGLLMDVAGGGSDMCLTGLDNFIAQNLAFGLFASMPFGMATGELEGWMHASDGADMLAMLAETYGVTMQFAGDQGVKPMWSKQPLPAMSAMQGLAIGSSGLGIANLQQAGATNVVDLASADLGSLDVIDGMSATEIAAVGLADTFTHVTTSNPNTPSSVLSLVTANSAMDALADSHKTVLKRACSAALNAARARSLHASATALASMDVNAQPMPDDVWQTLSSSAQGLLETIFNEGETQATVVDSYVYFLTDIAGWSEIGEAAFYKGRQRTFAL